MSEVIKWIIVFLVVLYGGALLLDITYDHWTSFPNLIVVTLFLYFISTKIIIAYINRGGKQ